MPIIDYKHEAELSRERLLNNEKISQKNKEALKKFLNAYNVSSARLRIFCAHIRWLLENCDDINIFMHDREGVNKLFTRLRNELSPSYYGTIVNVSMAFTRWLYDDDEKKKPKGFRDIKNIAKMKQKRDLNPADMLTNDDLIKMQDAINSTQLKAILGFQLDGGLRPSEFIDLNYGDISRNKEFFMCHIRKGKTGARDVILYNCRKELNDWLASHPFKDKNSPLWIREKLVIKNIKAIDKDGYARYNYAAVLKRVRTIADQVGITKPTDFYNFRHSSAVIKRLNGWTTEDAARNMGHSVEYFTQVYGRLFAEDKLKILRQVYGLDDKKEVLKSKDIDCPICGFINSKGAHLCSKCQSPLSVSAAIKMKGNYDQLKKELEETKVEMENLKIDNKKAITSAMKLVMMSINEAQGKDKSSKEELSKIFAKMFPEEKA